MDVKLKLWELLGVTFVIVVGTMLHFIYGLSGENPVVGLFGAVNESTWEHLKLLFWPTVLWTVIAYYGVGREYNNYFFAKAVAVFCAMLLIVVLFYSYTGIVGRNFFVIDILIFVLAAALNGYLSTNFLRMGLGDGKNAMGLLWLFAMGGAFFVCTLMPPEIGLFQDPVKGGYGIERQQSGKC